MPVAVNPNYSERFDLKTLPEGFVVIRRMNHGQKMTRGSFTDKMKFSASRKSKDMQGEMDLMQRSITLWEWSNLIAEHNLEIHIDPNDLSKGTRLLNLRDVKDIELVDAPVAEEISTYIGKVNNFEDDFDDPETLLGKSA